jgi:hypothetical protein
MIPKEKLHELCVIVKIQASQVREYREKNKSSLPEPVLQCLYRECDRLNHLEEILCAEIEETKS